MAAFCVTEAFCAICALCVENREGWWLSSCRSSVVVHNRNPGFNSQQLSVFHTPHKIKLVLLPAEARY